MIQLNHMNDSIESSAQGAPWLLLIHRLPPKPDYLRVKVRRRLQRIGAYPLKNSVYVLANTDEALEDFQWLQRAIVEEGGEATVCEASFVEGTTDAMMAAALERQVPATPPRPEPGAPPAAPRGGTWVTRHGVKVDRIASAWLIRRFIDPEARFAFVPARGHVPRPGELRFDMFGGEFTHEGDRCTFEVLLARFGLSQPALRAIGELVHDLDCKDEKFGRAEADGVARMIAGIVTAHADDAARLARGAPYFDDLYAAFARR
jgi:hypothetical protein